MKETFWRWGILPCTPAVATKLLRLASDYSIDAELKQL